MRVAIVDDVRKDAQLLREHLRRYQGDNGGEWETALYANAEDFLARYRPEFDPGVSGPFTKFPGPQTKAQILCPLLL